MTFSDIVLLDPPGGPNMNRVSEYLAYSLAQAYGWQSLWSRSDLSTKTNAYASPAVGVYDG